MKTERFVVLFLDTAGRVFLGKSHSAPPWNVPFPSLKDCSVFVPFLPFCSKKEGVKNNVPGRGVWVLSSSLQERQKHVLCGACFGPAHTVSPGPCTLLGGVGVPAGAGGILPPSPCLQDRPPHSSSWKVLGGSVGGGARWGRGLREEERRGLVGGEEGGVMMSPVWLRKTESTEEGPPELVRSLGEDMAETGDMGRTGHREGKGCTSEAMSRDFSVLSSRLCAFEKLCVYYM